MDPREFLDRYLHEGERLQLQADTFSDDQLRALQQIAFRFFGMGQHRVGDIEQVKYDGRLVMLDDGSRWEVDSSDSHTSDSWLPGDKVVVIDDEMFKLDDFEKVAVTEDLD